MENIITKVKEIKGVDWKGFAIMVDNEGYENAAFSLQQLSELVSTILIVVLIVSVVILSLILTLWSRTVSMKLAYCFHWEYASCLF